MKTLDIHVVTSAAKAEPATEAEAKDQTFHVLTATRKDAKDTSPLQYVSASQLAYYRAVEQAAVTFMDAMLALSPHEPSTVAPPPAPAP